MVPGANEPGKRGSRPKALALLLVLLMLATLIGYMAHGRYAMGLSGTTVLVDFDIFHIVGRSAPSQERERIA